MKIADVEAISLVVPMGKAIRSPISLPHADTLAGIVFKEYRTTLVRIKTDEGITGVGECMVRLAPTATRDIVDYVKPILIGTDPFDIEKIWDLLYGTMMNRGHYKGFYMEAVSGIDVALWDVMGKALRMPVYKLLGGKTNDKLWAYASSLRFRGMDRHMVVHYLAYPKGARFQRGPDGRYPVAAYHTWRHLLLAHGYHPYSPHR